MLTRLRRSRALAHVYDRAEPVFHQVNAGPMRQGCRLSCGWNPSQALREVTGAGWPWQVGERLFSGVAPQESQEYSASNSIQEIYD